jgi:uncharacterized membrane protein
MKKQKVVKLLYNLGIAITAIQTYILTSGIPNLQAHEVTIVTGVISVISSFVTTIYHYLHKSIPNRIAYTGLVFIIISFLGALNEVFKIIPLSSNIGGYITYSISILSFILQVIFKQVYQPKKKDGI